MRRIEPPDWFNKSLDTLKMTQEHTARESDASATDGGIRIEEVRYSLREMMETVKIERRHGMLGRALVDSTEIRQMFSKRKRKKT